MEEWLENLERERRHRLDPARYWHTPCADDGDSWPDEGPMLLIAVNRDGHSDPTLMLGDWRTLEDLVRAYSDVMCATVRWAYASEIARWSGM